MSLIGYIRKVKLSTAIDNRLLKYQKYVDNDSLLTFQLDKFNICWKLIIKQVPYYTNLKKNNVVPLEFKSWQEFIEKVPIISKDMVQRNTKEMTNQYRKADFLRITGGTTSQPIQLPAWYSENKETQIDIWVARKWYGIDPNCKLFMIWGHSHLLGSGVKGKLNTVSRNIKDWTLGYYRYSAYDMNFTKLKQAAKELLNFKPDYIIGYSVALDAFARANQDLKPKLRDLGVKVVIGAAESFPNEDSEAVISTLFNCPVAMEYGSVETNLVAHTYPLGGYRVFWHNYFIEAIDSRDGNSKILRITSLYNRCFPLIRYEIGDEVEIYEEDDGVGLWRFKKVVGRCNLFVLLTNGAKIHSEVFTHCVRDCSEIAAYQIIQSQDGIKMLIVPREGYSKQVEEKVKGKLNKIYPDLCNIKFELVNKLVQTIAGKTPMVIKKD